MEDSRMYTGEGLRCQCYSACRMRATTVALDRKGQPFPVRAGHENIGGEGIFSGDPLTPATCTDADLLPHWLKAELEHQAKLKKRIAAAQTGLAISEETARIVEAMKRRQPLLDLDTVK